MKLVFRGKLCIHFYAANVFKNHALLIRPDEVLSGIANTPILKVGDNSLRRALEQSHVLVGGIA